MRKRGTFNKMSRAEGEGRLGTREKNREFLDRMYQKELLLSSQIPATQLIWFSYPYFNHINSILLSA